MADDSFRATLIDSVLESFRKNYPEESTYKRKPSFFYDEIKFMEEFGCLSFEQYSQIERTGRADAYLKRENRMLVYKVYLQYYELRKAANKNYDWYDLATHVYYELENDTSVRRYKHIVIDEGQDFSPMMIRSLLKAIPDDGSFTFFGDVAQQIYGNKISWKSSGININRIWRFSINYRNPETVVMFAKELTKSSYWKKSEFMVDCEEVKAVGPKPVLIKFQDEDKERDWVASRAILESQKSSVVIICRNRMEIDKYNKMLRSKGYTATVIDRNTPGFADRNEIYISTYHSVKGLEFYNVFIPMLTSEMFPSPEMLEKAYDMDELYADELKLLYVAVTRSKYGVFMSYSGNLTELFPMWTSTVDYKEI